MQFSCNSLGKIGLRIVAQNAPLMLKIVLKERKEQKLLKKMKCDPLPLNETQAT